MAEVFLQMTKEDRGEALAVAAARIGQPVHLLEKDVWVVWALRTMFESAFGPSLVFKGGTSLSKAYRAIQRFSEDVDLTYDIRAIAPELIAQNKGHTLPQTRSQEKKWTGLIRELLAKWVAEEVLPLIRGAIEQQRLAAEATVDPQSQDIVRIKYEHTAEGSGYVQPVVILEFGARSTGEPSEPIEVRCDAAESLPSLLFPVSTPRVMRVERTFWEKATAVHVFCMGGKLRGSRFSRHWYDLVQLSRRGHAEAALKRRDIAEQVASHKAVFFSEKGEGGKPIDYPVAVSGRLLLVPGGLRLAALAEDYRKMVEDGLLQDASSFEEIIASCRQLQDRLNGV